MYVVKRLGKGLLKTFLLTLFFIGFFLAVFGPVVVAFELHWSGWFLYIPHFIILVWEFGD